MSQAQSTLLPEEQQEGAHALLLDSSVPRMVLFVALNLAGYVAANAFLHYLTTGSWIDLSFASFGVSMLSPLGKTLLQPLSIFAWPWMIVVVGLLVAVVIFVPIIVAVLYRLWISTFFILAVAVVGHAPLLAVFLGLGCLLAGKTRLRSSVPFLAFMVGLVPVMLYLYVFTAPSEHDLFGLRWFALYIPFILANVVAVLAAALVLLLARLTRYRPIIVWPVLLMCLAVPVALFHFAIGPAEMAFSVLAEEVQSGEGFLGTQTVEEFRRLHLTTSPAGRTYDATLAAVQSDLERRRSSLLKRCGRFMKRYPDSPRGPAVMWIQASALDMQIDPLTFPNGLIRITADYPCGGSVEMWSLLSERYGRTPQGMVAQERLGVAALRGGRIKQAQEHLQQVRAQLGAYLDGQSDSVPAGAWSRVFSPAEPLPSDDFCRDMLHEACHLLWLMEVNKVSQEQPANAEAFADYMRLWPFRGVSKQELRELARRHGVTPLADNFLLQSAMQERQDMDRAAALDTAASEVNDAAIIANYELGRMALRLGKSPEWTGRGLRPAEEYFRIVVNAPESPYSAMARQDLSLLCHTQTTQP